MTPVALVLGGVVLVVISVFDIRQRRIPNACTYPALAGCGGLALAAVVAGDGAAVAPAIAGSVLFGSLLFAPHVADPKAMGAGDIKLGLVLGFAIGWVRPDTMSAIVTVGWTLAAASLFGLLAATLVNHRKGWRPTRGQSVAFGPWLSAAGAIAIIWSLA